MSLFSPHEIKRESENHTVRENLLFELLEQVSLLDVKAFLVVPVLEPELRVLPSLLIVLVQVPNLRLEIGNITLVSNEEPRMGLPESPVYRERVAAF